MTVRHIVKGLLKRALHPARFAALQAISARRYARQLELRRGLLSQTAAFVENHGRKVQYGPFKGLNYPAECLDRYMIPRLAGTYEMELHPILEEFIKQHPSLIIDIGCAEGYYAVGLAQRCPQAAIIAFDTDPLARRKCEALARENGVSTRLTTYSFCTPDSLRSSILPDSLLILDCEGAEIDLITSVPANVFLNSNLLIEIHGEAPSLTHPIAQHFTASHRPITVPSRPRTEPIPPELDHLSLPPELLTEMRPSWQGWLILYPIN